MPPKKEPQQEVTGHRGQPATDPKHHEQQMIELAIRQAEKQMSDGTASSQVITHYLKLGSSRDQAEVRRIELETLKVQAQIAHLESQNRGEELMGKVLASLQRFAGSDDDDL